MNRHISGILIGLAALAISMTPSVFGKSIANQRSIHIEIENEIEFRSEGEEKTFNKTYGFNFGNSKKFADFEEWLLGKGAKIAKNVRIRSTGLGGEKKILWTRM
jgi:hypothetical protein